MAASVRTTSTGNSVTTGAEQGRGQHPGTELELSPAPSTTPAPTVLPGGVEGVLLHGDSGAGLGPAAALRRLLCTLKQRDVSTAPGLGEHEPPWLPMHTRVPGADAGQEQGEGSRLCWTPRYLEGQLAELGDPLIPLLGCQQVTLFRSGEVEGGGGFGAALGACWADRDAVREADHPAGTPPQGGLLQCRAIIPHIEVLHAGHTGGAGSKELGSHLPPGPLRRGKDTGREIKKKRVSKELPAASSQRCTPCRASSAREEPWGAGGGTGGPCPQPVGAAGGHGELRPAQTPGGCQAGQSQSWVEGGPFPERAQHGFLGESRSLPARRAPGPALCSPLQVPACRRCS